MIINRKNSIFILILLTKENAEQLLNSVMQDEKDVQDKVKKQQKVIQGGRLEKDW